MSSDIFSRLENVVERFLQKRIYYWEVHQDKKLSSKKFWRRISFLEIIFKTNNLNRKYSTRRGDNQIRLKTRKYWRYIQLSLVRRKSVVVSLNFTSQCCLHCEGIFVNIFERSGRFKFVHMKKKEKLSHIRNVKSYKKGKGQKEKLDRLCESVSQERFSPYKVVKKDNVFCRKLLLYLMNLSKVPHRHW